MPVRKNRKEPEEALRAIKLMQIWPWVERHKEGTEEGCVAVVVQLLSCAWLCNPMDCSMPGFCVLHYLPEFAQTHVYWVGDAIQPPHPLLPPFSLVLNLSPHQGLFQWVSFSHQVAKVLELQWIFSEHSGLISFRIDWFDILVVQGTLKSLLQHHSSKEVLSLLYGPTLTSIHGYWKNHSFDYMKLCQQSDVCFLICCLGLSSLFFQAASVF